MDSDETQRTCTTRLAHGVRRHVSAWWRAGDMLGGAAAAALVLLTWNVASDIRAHNDLAAAVAAIQSNRFTEADAKEFFRPVFERIAALEVRVADLHPGDEGEVGDE